jgi:hypothetical protein
MLGDDAVTLVEVFLHFRAIKVLLVTLGKDGDSVIELGQVFGEGSLTVFDPGDGLVELNFR